MRRNPTPAEKAFAGILKRLKIPFKSQWVVMLPYRYYIIDFVISRNPRRLVEIDGSSHDGREKYDTKRERDILYSGHFNGYEFIRFTNSQCFNGEAEKTLRDIYLLHAAPPDPNVIRLPRERWNPPKKGRRTMRMESRMEEYMRMFRKDAEINEKRRTFKLKMQSA